MKFPVELVYANNMQEAENARDGGFEPVECAFGSSSVVGPRILDHHGPYSANEAVSIRAAKLVAGGDSCNKFVVAGRPDHDQIYACGVLSLNIPANLDQAEAVAEMDVDPIGRDRTSPRYLPEILFEQGTQGIARNLSGAQNALNCLIDIYSRPHSSEEIALALRNEEIRKRNVLEKIVLNAEGKVALAISEERGFGEWYTKAPIVVLYNPRTKGITLGLNPKKGTPFFNYNGFDLIGNKGFSSLYQEFDNATQKKGAGGREVIGGSPRGVIMNEEDARAYYQILLEASGKNGY